MITCWVLYLTPRFLVVFLNLKGEKWEIKIAEVSFLLHHQVIHK